MSRVILVPFDDSTAGRIAVGRAVTLARCEQGRVVLAVPSVAGDALVDALCEARRRAGEDVRVDAQRIGVAQAGERFAELVEALRPAMVVVPMNAPAGSRALREIAGAVLRHPAGCTVAVDVGHVAARSAEALGQEEIDERRGVDTADAGLLRGIARLYLGLRAAVRGGAR